MRVVAVLIMLICIGCKTHRTIYVPAESKKTEYIDRIKKDSIYTRDSVFLFVKGDTVLLEKYITRYRDRIISDSIVIRDTIPVPYEVVKEKLIKQPLKWYEKAFMYLGVGCFAALLVGLYFKFKK